VPAARSRSSRTVWFASRGGSVARGIYIPTSTPDGASLFQLHRSGSGPFITDPIPRGGWGVKRETRGRFAKKRERKAGTGSTKSTNGHEKRPALRVLSCFSWTSFAAAVFRGLSRPFANQGSRKSAKERRGRGPRKARTDTKKGRPFVSFRAFRGLPLPPLFFAAFREPSACFAFPLFPRRPGSALAAAEEPR